MQSPPPRTTAESVSGVMGCGYGGGLGVGLWEKGYEGGVMGVVMEED